MTPWRLSDVPDVLEFHEVPSEEARIVPPSPTATKNGAVESVVVELSVVELSVVELSVVSCQL